MRAAAESGWGLTIQPEVLGGSREVLAYTPRRRHLRELFLDAEGYGNRPFLISGDRQVSFAEYVHLASRRGQALQDAGIGKGSTVVLLGANSPEWVIAFGAVVASGATVVLGNAWWSEKELAHSLDLVGAALVVADEPRRASVPASCELLAMENVSEVPDLAPATIEAGGPDAGLDEDSPAVVVFTSGTTGLPKGVVLSHRSVIATLHALLATAGRLPGKIQEELGGRGPASLLSMPLFHVGGLQQIVTPLVRGMTLVFHEGRFDPAAVLDIVERHEVGTWSAVPTMITRVLDHLESTDRTGPQCLRTLSLGGAPVPEKLRRRVATAFPNLRDRLVISYGMTEAGGLVASGSTRELAQRPQSVGKPLPTVEIRIRGAAETAPGTEGEIQLRSPAVMSGYVMPTSPGAPIRTEPGDVEGDGWLRTGDLGWVDADGYLYVTGRSKDVVIRGGENIATIHVENQLLSHPAVREAAVFGLPHSSLGEELAAVVVVDAGSMVSENDLVEHLRPLVASFAIPTRWRLTSQPLPTSAVGKVLKRALRDSWSSEMHFDVPPAGAHGAPPTPTSQRTRTGA